MIVARAAVMALAALATLSTPGAAEDRRAAVETIVRQVVQPLMERHGIPGMAVGVIAEGQAEVYDFGVASAATHQRVTNDTLFEIGSLSKTFTATLAAYAAVEGRLALTDRVGQDFPPLRGSSFDQVSLIDLATHTPGGMPLQVPDAVMTDDQLLAYFRAWTPAYRPGTTRTYANPSIGLLGLVTASRMGEPFAALVDRHLFQPLGMTHSYIEVPATETENYAQGYTKADRPTRMAPGPLAEEAYGIRTTAADMLRFLAANLGLLDLPTELQRAIRDTHTGYDRLGPMTQDLIWEQYHYPVTLDDLLAGNSAQVSYQPNPVTRLDPPLPPGDAVLVNKTGSTNGFAAYVAFIPAKKLGLVLLANKNVPVDVRVTAAHAILSRLTGGEPPDSR